MASSSRSAPATRARPLSFDFTDRTSGVDRRKAWLNVPTAEEARWGQTGEERRKRNSDLAKDAWQLMAKRTPLTMDAFLHEFLPAPQRSQDKPRRTRLFKGVSECCNAEEILKQLATALNDASDVHSLCPGLRFHLKSYPGGGDSTRPPVVCCLANSTAAPLRHSEQGVDLGFAELFIDAHPDPVTDFVDCVHPRWRISRGLIAQSEEKEASLRIGETVTCAAEIFGRQHRRFCFSVSVSGTLYRIFHWDRAGVSVTRAHDLHEDPGYLCEFLWRFAHASDEGRGFDPTVRPATEEQEVSFERVVRRHAQEQILCEDNEALADAMEEHYVPGRVAQVAVVDGDDQQVYWYTVSRPVVSPYNLWNKGTRGWWAVSEDGSITFLKEIWRVGTEYDEGRTLDHLQRANVRHVPVALHYGNVWETPNRAMDAGYSEYESETEFDELTKGTAHYRIATDTVGYDLKRVTGAKDLLFATRDILEALQDAQKWPKIHRDVSIGNILLVVDRKSKRCRGCLIDWEYSADLDAEGKPYDDAHGTKFQFGTPSFMSVDRLNCSGPHSIEDDMESLLYVVLYCALRDSKTTTPAADAREACRALFSRPQRTKQGRWVCPPAKAKNQQDRRITKGVRFRSNALNHWLDTMLKLNSSRDTWTYQRVAHEWDRILAMWDELQAGGAKEEPSTGPGTAPPPRADTCQEVNAKADFDERRDNRDEQKRKAPHDPEEAKGRHATKRPKVELVVKFTTNKRKAQNLPVVEYVKDGGGGRVKEEASLLQRRQEEEEAKLPKDILKDKLAATRAWVEAQQACIESMEQKADIWQNGSMDTEKVDCKPSEGGGKRKVDAGPPDQDDGERVAKRVKETKSLQALSGTNKARGSGEGSVDQRQDSRAGAKKFELHPPLTRQQEPRFAVSTPKVEGLRVTRSMTRALS
ncbi:hypothetical protein WOLCODRAFT_163397 [Wolfiporia cocos MD-104 SS10]|uniref:Fungal-type protein kinase domain-containing protein n=1 Tax=Wolfiporia cocos (strain MD-104) TaxID=742152 RepID=A0A2H3JI64_WOLCO|nr:hypothetical protein WOLCODRAFT_163397 [Wolfiporia cocos MD-104 SS10]